MVNIVIYLNDRFDSNELVRSLLTEKLIASATIDLNNTSYVFENNEIKENVYSVITAQSKSLLFTEIVRYIENRYDEKIPINSTPIIGSNRAFNDFIFNKTIKI